MPIDRTQSMRSLARELGIEIIEERLDDEEVAMFYRHRSISGKDRDQVVLEMQLTDYDHEFILAYACALTMTLAISECEPERYYLFNADGVVSSQDGLVADMSTGHLHNVDLLACELLGIEIEA